MKVVKGFTAIAVAVAFVLSMSISPAMADDGSYQLLLKRIEDLEKENKVMQASVNKIIILERENEKLSQEVNVLNSEMGKVIAQTINAPVITEGGEVVNVPSWIEGTKFGGDLRVRWQSRYNQSSTASDRQRMRVRLRYGISKQVNEQLFAKFRMVTGTSSDQGVNQHTVGTGFKNWDMALDQVYLKYSPSWMEGLDIYAGKFEANWKRKDWLWYVDYMPEGFGQSYEFDITDGLKGYVNTAQLIVSEDSVEDADSELYVFQAGVNGGEEITYDIYSTLYWFDGYSQSGAAVLDAGTAIQGNPLVGVLTGSMGFDVMGKPASAFAQFGKNFNTRGSQEESLHYALGVDFGKLAKAGDWKCGYTFGYLEDNVFPENLNDPDLGTTGAEMHKFLAAYRLFNSTTVQAEVLIPRAINVTDDSTNSVISKVQWTTKF